MGLKESVDFVVDKELQDGSFARLAEFFVFVVEIALFVLFVVYGIVLFWQSKGFSDILKYLLIVFFIIVSFDVFKTFVYTRWMLFKELAAV